MTVLSAMQSAAIRLIGRKPTTFFSSTQRFEQEIVDLANEVAKSIADNNDWQALTRIHTITGDGTTTAFAMPDDYDRMLLDSRIYDSESWAWGYQRIVRADEWLEFTIRDFAVITPGMWTMLENQFQFLPAPADQASAKFLYITNKIVKDENDAGKTSFTADSDTFVLNERLLTLGLIWRWREQKRMDSGADEANFNQLYSELAGRDGGARPIIRNSRHNLYRGNIAWPWPLGGQ